MHKSDFNVVDWLRLRTQARPFLRWAGGKQPFLARFEQHLPKIDGRYIEPFLGSGALFFHYSRLEKRPFESFLADTNLQLILTYQAIKKDPYKVQESLDALKSAYVNSSDPIAFYLDQRALFNKTLPRVDPARFIFMNRTCWNGLYRVNRDGKFNVPHGTNKGDVFFPDINSLLAAQAALANTVLRASPWEHTVGTAIKGDFIFADPPYFSECEPGKTKYSRLTFSKQDHFSLGRALKACESRGVDFLLCNSAEPEIIAFYESLDFDIARIEVPRFINSKAELRLAANEIIVRPQSKGYRERQLLLITDYPQCQR